MAQNRKNHSLNLIGGSLGLIYIAGGMVVIGIPAAILLIAFPYVFLPIYLVCIWIAIGYLRRSKHK
jgi:hypothetical protein